MKQEPKKPSNVPNDAYWIEEDQEWSFGQFSPEEKKIGEWKWWKAPDGYLICHTFYNEQSEIQSYTRYHPDGTYSQKGTYQKGLRHGLFYYQRSEHETPEITIPDQAPQNVFVMVCDFNMGNYDPAKIEFYDKEGRELDHYGRHITLKYNNLNKEDAIKPNYWSIEGKNPKLWAKKPSKKESEDIIKEFFFLLQQGKLDEAENIIGHQCNDWDSQIWSLWQETYLIYLEEKGKSVQDDSFEGQLWKTDLTWLKELSIESKFHWEGTKRFFINIVYAGIVTDVSADFNIIKCSQGYYIEREIIHIH